MLGQDLGVDALAPFAVLRLALAPSLPVGGQVRLELGEDQLDVKEPLTVVDEVQEISVLLGLADHLDGVRVLEALVVVAEECHKLRV